MQEIPSSPSVRETAQALACVSRGKALIGQGQYAAALESLDQAAAIHPRLLDAQQLRGGVLYRLGRYEEALAGFDAAVALEPRFVHGWISRGSALMRLGRPQAALESFARAAQLAPAQAEVHYNLGCALNALERHADAAASFDRAIALNPGYAEAHNNRAVALAALKRYGEALASHDAAVRLRPEIADGHVNRGVTLELMGRHGDARDSYAQAVAAAPDSARAHWNLGLCSLLLGDFDRGWQHFEWRWRYGGGEPPDFGRPRWTGAQPLEGKTVLLFAEQGYGDTLQFCRYAESVARRGARVLLRVPRPLAGLLASLSGAAAVFDEAAALPPFDYQCPLMSLPQAFGTALATIPARIPYLSAPPAKRAAWRERLGERTGLRVGLVWSGGFRADQPGTWEINRRRNVPLAALAALALPGVSFYSLQQGEDAVAQLRELEAAGWNGPRIVDFTAELADFSDTAAFVDNLDLVIAVDTSVAHLAGALGREVWLLNRFDTCWRWLLGRDDSPWYPGMRLFRQAAPGDWEGVVADVRRALQARLDGR